MSQTMVDTTAKEIKVTRTPELVAAEINGIKEQTRKLVLVNAIEIGKRLAEAKEMVPYGEWGKWLGESVDYSQSTATNLINIFEAYAAKEGQLFGVDAKSQAFEKLSYTQAVALLGVPEEEREAFVENNDVASMSTREFQKLVADKKEADQAAAEFRRMHQEDIDRIDKLEKDLEKVKKNPDKDKLAIKTLKASLKTAKEELEEAQKKAAKPTIIEKVPEKIQEELAKLKKQIKHSDADNSFKATAELFNDLFEKLMSYASNNDKHQKALISIIEAFQGAVKANFGEDNE